MRSWYDGAYADVGWALTDYINANTYHNETAMPLPLAILLSALFWLVLGGLYCVYRVRTLSQDPGAAVIRRAEQHFADKGLRLVALGRGLARRNRYDVLDMQGRPQQQGLTFFQLEALIDRRAAQRGILA